MLRFTPVSLIICGDLYFYIFNHCLHALHSLHRDPLLQLIKRDIVRIFT